MKLSKFKFKLPDELIAQYPSKHRDESRLMVLHRKTGEIEHRVFKDVLEYYNENDLFVFNDTKVFPARLFGNKEKTGAQIEVFLLRELNHDMRLWDVLVEPARKIRIGNKLYFGEDDSVVAEVIDNTTSRGRTLRFLFDGTHEEFKKSLFNLGETPLPRNITRAVEADDAQRSFVTSHMSLGNFREIDVEDLTKHKMDSEQMAVTQEAADTINKAHDEGKNICAVGVTVMRALETVAGTEGRIKTFDGWTNKFIFPPYDFTVANSLITNFHLPYSTLLMLTAAFGDYDHVMNAYEVALKEGYRFGVYGDAMLIL